MAAALLLVRDGYEATSMSKLAQHAGVAPNTLYWYFQDKDDLLVAVADRYLHTLLAELGTVTAEPLAEQFHWLVDRLRPVKHLVATVHNRLAVSPVIDEWHTGFHRTLEQVFAANLPHPIPADRRVAEVAAATFTLEGAITHAVDADTTRGLCAIAADRLMTAATAHG
ncbi:TetR/AcrR family transcriptional regulator [Actinokineospora bangkokensis]|uniref:TetR/AcrR family transcriptional regulator n=1 Tax=Actinokineospora bangkokensis TaxID=1193682 RepID=UPI0013016AB6|nr:TetR/AcrR family transcriptional regulator [Actinokineospora bangkokensis]